MTNLNSTWSIHRAFSMQANLNRENMLFRWHVPVTFVHGGKSAMNAPHPNRMVLHLPG
jgi:hypothetical protein